MANTATTTDSTADRIEVLESRDARPGIDDMRVVHGVGEGTPVPRRLDELSDSSTMYEIDLDRSTQSPSVTHSDGKPVWTLNKVVSMAVGMASAAAVLGGAVVITQSKSVSSVSKVPYDSPFPRWPGPTTTPLSGTEHATPQALVDELFVPSEDGTPLLDPLRLRNAMERFTTEAMFRGIFGPGSGLPALDVPIEQNVLENDLGRITDGNPPINLPERLLPFSEAQKAGVLMATHAFAATFASLFRYPLGDIPTAIGAKLDTGSAYSDLIAGFTMRKAIVLDPTQFNATTIGSAQFHDLIHHRKRTINPVDTPILLVDEAFTETLTSHCGPAPSSATVIRRPTFSPCTYFACCRAETSSRRRDTGTAWCAWRACW